MESAVVARAQDLVNGEMCAFFLLFASWNNSGVQEGSGSRWDKSITVQD